MHQQILACRKCVEAGHLGVAMPMFQGRPGQRLMLIGQAPGIKEVEVRKPFAWRAGRQLERWMVRAGFADDDHFRALTYITSVTKCFPGKAASGSGDRRPSRAEVELCLPWLWQQLELVQPRLILLLGTLAIDQFMPGRSLESLVGHLFDTDGVEITTTRAGDSARQRWLLPLPHPSGASRWLNDPAHREMLETGLEKLRVTWPRLVV
ncbi:MAG: uracil-DNA glycosylase family protein [Candidatus Dormibacteraeota bacterium]|nr:uracil-DNA glycosylase family protein [Candidatus Dormibacteraeota bacterium]